MRQMDGIDIGREGAVPSATTCVENAMPRKAKDLARSTSSRKAVARAVAAAACKRAGGGRNIGSMQVLFVNLLSMRRGLVLDLVDCIGGASHGRRPLDTCMI